MSFNFGHEDPDELWREFGNPNTPWPAKIDILFKLAAIAYHERTYRLEIQYLESALEIAKEHNLDSERNRTLLALSLRVADGLGDPKRAISYADELISHYPSFQPEVEVLERMGAIRLSKATSLMKLKRYAEATYELKLVLEYAELISDLPETALANLNLMRCHIELDNLESAKKCGEAARELYQDHSQLISLCEVDRLFARISMLEGNPLKAKEELEEIRVLEQRIYKASSPETKLYLGRALMLLGQTGKAIKILERLVDQSVKPWSNEFDIALMAAEWVEQCYLGEGNTEAAARIAVLRRALRKRVPGGSRQEVEEGISEVQHLRSSGQKDIAVSLAKTLLEKANKAGDLNLRWKMIHEMVITLWEFGDYLGIAEIWDEISHEALNMQDEIVIDLKNRFTNALRNVGRFEESLLLNDEVMTDIRIKDDPVQQAFAVENAARIHKDLRHTAEAKKLKDRSVEAYLELGDSQRALGIIHYFGKRRGNRDEGRG